MTGGRSGTIPIPSSGEYEAGVTGTVEVTGGQLPPSIPQDVAHQVYGTPGFIAPERYSEVPGPLLGLLDLGFNQVSGFYLVLQLLENLGPGRCFGQALEQIQ